jgi:hypothetical protein
MMTIGVSFGGNHMALATHSTLTEMLKTQLSMPALILKMESLAVFIGAIALYAQQQGDGLAFVLLLFTPDLSMVGYLANPRLGSILYNLAHTYVTPGIILAVSLATGLGVGVQLACILFAHSGIDRVMGYGLKYADAFKHTHLS